MATRASIKFKDEDGNFIANVYHHYDGFPEYLGAKLIELTNAPITNGIRLNSDGTRPKLGDVFNGVGCMVATVIAGLKTDIGNVYLYTENDFGNCGEDYLYEVIVEDGRPKVLVQNIDGDWEFVEDILARTESLYTDDELPF